MYTHLRAKSACAICWAKIILHSHPEIEISFKFIPKILMSKKCISFLGHSVLNTIIWPKQLYKIFGTTCVYCTGIIKVQRRCRHLIVWCLKVLKHAFKHEVIKTHFRVYRSEVIYYTKLSVILQGLNNVVNTLTQATISRNKIKALSFYYFIDYTLLFTLWRTDCNTLEASKNFIFNCLRHIIPFNIYNVL